MAFAGSSEIYFRHQPFQVDLQPIVPVTFLPALVILAFYQDTLNLEKLSIPFLLLDSSFGTSEAPTPFRPISNAKRLRSVFNAISLHECTKVEGTITCKAPSAEQAWRFVAHFHDLLHHVSSPGPLAPFMLTPEICEPQEDIFNPSPKSPGIYMLTFTETGRITGGRASCWACRVPNQPSPFEAFHCNHQSSVGTSCWTSMRSALNTVMQNGQALRWRGSWPIEEAANSCLGSALLGSQATTMDFFPIGDQLVLTLFSRANLSESSGSYCKRIPFHQSSFLDQMPVETFHPGNMDNDVVYITQDLVFSGNKAVDLYLSVFDWATWASLLLALFSASALISASVHIKSGRHRTVVFARVILLLCRTFLDQHVEIVHRFRRWPKLEHVVRCIAICWILALLLVSNLFKSTLKSKYSLLFPYTTKIGGWRDLTDHSVYLLDDSSNCTCADPTGPISYPVNDEWIRNESQGLNYGHKTCYATPIGLRIFKYHVENKLTSMTYGQLMMAEMNRCSNSRNVEGFKCGMDQMFDLWGRSEMICPNCIHLYCGNAYLEKVAYWRRVAAKPTADWNVTLVKGYESPCFNGEDGGIQLNVTTTFDDLIKLYWMTRRPRTAFALTKAMFPWYWNLFKKAMRRDPKLKFAVTGPGATLRKQSRMQLLKRNDAPFYLTTAKYRFVEEARWVLLRLAAMSEAGLLNFMYKWDLILRPPRSERWNDEVDEANSEVHPLSVKDPALEVLFLAVAMFSGVAIAAFLVEVLLSKVFGGR